MSRNRMRRAAFGWIGGLLAAGILALCGFSRSQGTTPPAPGDTAHAVAALAEVPVFCIPSDSLIPADELGAAIRRGRNILLATRDSLPHNVGNQLHCVSCHLDAGTRMTSGSWVGSYASFPQYNPRGARVFRMEDRINECLRRSLNGRPLRLESRAMGDMVAYMAFLSRGIPQGTKAPWLGLKRLPPLKGDAKSGGRTFSSMCVKCHGQKGEGTVTATPLWGPQSFAVGAGMARISTLAAFLRWNMPFDRPGTLDDRQAYDLAAFILSHPRADTPGKERDWPKGGRPEDCPYRTAAAP